MFSLSLNERSFRLSGAKKLFDNSESFFPERWQISHFFVIIHVQPSWERISLRKKDVMDG